MVGEIKLKFKVGELWKNKHRHEKMNTDDLKTCKNYSFIHKLYDYVTWIRWIEA